MKLQVLYFEGCPNHPPAVELMREVAAELGIDAAVEVVEVKDQAEAERLRFLGSPTLRVDGVDVEPEARTRTDFAFSCRMYGGKGLPPREMVVAAIRGEPYGAPNGEPDACEGGCCSEPVSESPDETRHVQRAGAFAAGGSVLTAVAASACCWLPLALIAFGLSAGGVSAGFEKYRLLFLAVTGLLLASGFYLIYLRKPVCEPGSACAVPNPKLQRFNRVMLWVATVVVVAFAFFPNYAGYLLADSTATEVRDDGGAVSTVSFRIDGMTCEACAVVVRNALTKVPGVTAASVSYEEGQALVTVDASSPPSTTVLIEAVEGAGYQASPVVDGK